MKIAISTLVTPIDKSGIGNYVLNLLSSLQRIDHENEYFVFVGQDTRVLFALTSPNFHLIETRFRFEPRWIMRPLYYVWQNTLVSRHLARCKVDLLHLPNLCPLFIRHRPTVVTIPDLTEHMVAKYTALRQAYRKMLPYLTARTASHIITISESSKNDIVSATGLDPSKVTVTHLAPGIPNPGSADNLDSAIRRYGIGERYFLHVGGALPHKNLSGVISAYATLRAQHNVDYQLVLVGNKNTAAAQRMIESAGLGGRGCVIQTGYITDEELSAIYCRASALVFPSFYEGFGLPILEAMVRGVPVITSKVSSLPEVAGDAAMLVDPMRSDEIARAMHSVTKDRTLRNEMIERGRVQASQFSWERCASETINTYKSVLEL